MAALGLMAEIWDAHRKPKAGQDTWQLLHRGRACQLFSKCLQIRCLRGSSADCGTRLAYPTEEAAGVNIRLGE